MSKVHHIPLEEIDPSFFSLILVCTFIEVASGKMAYEEVRLCAIERILNHKARKGSLTLAQSALYEMLVVCVHDRPQIRTHA